MLLLLDRPGVGLTTWTPHLRHRLVARLRAAELDRTLAAGVSPDSTRALVDRTPDP
jgi:hypothetical protein